MKFTILALATLVCSLSTMAASTPSQSMPQFCEDRASLKSVKELTSTYENLMSFRNQGGLGNGGVCWWHSRMQRNALYLTIFQPNEAAPNDMQIKEIVSKLRAGKEIVIIPGYVNFASFSYYNQAVIQRELEKWQKSDGITKFNWVVGLKGKTSVKAEKLNAMMDELYQYIEVEGNIAYQKLQMKGVVAHAWLVVNMKKTQLGYDLEVIDSNFPNQTSIYKYRAGMTNFFHSNYGEFVPYLERTAEMENVTNAVMKECKPEEYKIKMEIEAQKREEERLAREQEREDRR